MDIFLFNVHNFNQRTKYICDPTLLSTICYLSTILRIAARAMATLNSLATSIIKLRSRLLYIFPHLFRIEVLHEKSQMFQHIRLVVEDSFELSISLHGNSVQRPIRYVEFKKIHECIIHIIRDPALVKISKCNPWSRKVRILTLTK